MFEDCRVPKRNLLGEKGHGFRFAMKGLNGGRVNIASCSLGGAAFALEQAILYSQERKQFGDSLSKKQNIQFKIADMTTDLITSRLVVREAAKLLDDPESTSRDQMMYSAMAKKHATDVCFDVNFFLLGC